VKPGALRRARGRSGRRLRPAAPRRGLACVDARCADCMYSENGATTPAAWLCSQRARPAAGGARDGAACGKLWLAHGAGHVRGPFGSLADNPGESHEWAALKAKTPACWAGAQGTTRQPTGRSEHTHDSETQASLHNESRWRPGGRLLRAAPVPPGSHRGAAWLILPVVICLSQRLSHACLSMSCSY